jgi:uncharacterized DUF497 family protein
VRFEWDPGKARSNLRKHGVSFTEAAECFADPLAIDYIDKANAGRSVLVGQSRRHRLVITVYVEKRDDVIRIVSARCASRSERKRYEEGEI